MALKDAFQKLVSRLPSASLFIAEKMAKSTVSRMISLAPTKRIKGAIRLDKVVRDGSVIVATINIDLDEETGAPEARAYEFGSGEKSTGPNAKKEKYLISPKKGNYLAFFWDKAYPSIPRAKDGRVLLKKVMHPGVEAKPYIQPAIDELKKGAKRIISERIRLEIGAAFSEAQDK